MDPHFGDGDWRSIAEQTSKENDPAKLTVLVAKLCHALTAEREDMSRRQRHLGIQP